jgi:hypothetical protein
MRNDHYSIRSGGLLIPLNDSRTGDLLNNRVRDRHAAVSEKYSLFSVMAPSNPSLEPSAHEKLYITAR